MERKTGHVPQSATPPEVEEAKRHLSWTPEEDEPDQSDAEVAEIFGLIGEQMFTTYTGYPDGSFEVTITIERRGTVAVQTQRGGDNTKAGAITDAARLAYEAADRASNLLSDQPLPVIDEDEDGDPT